MSEHLYSPLRSKTSFRLLTLNPGLPGTPLTANLDEAKLEDRPKYEALSYTWGPPGNEKEISVNEFPFFLRANLWQFLQRIRLADRLRVVWIDAICISQTDLIEKALQVAMIGQIFRSARGVRVWLGEHADGSEKLFGRHDINENIEWFAHRFSRNFSVRLHRGDSKSMNDIWIKLLRRPYFFRTWIVQEILNAWDVTVHCGEDSAPWTDLIASRLRIKDSLDPYLALCEESPRIHDRLEHLLIKDENSIRHVADIRRFSMRYYNPPGTPTRWYSIFREYGQLLNITRNPIHRSKSRDSDFERDIFDLLGQFRRTKCVDRRDKVYALLSLAKVNTSLVPDYTITMPQLYFKLCHEALAGTDEMYGTHANMAMKSLSLTGNELLDVAQMLLDETGALRHPLYQILREILFRMDVEDFLQLTHDSNEDRVKEAEGVMARFRTWIHEQETNGENISTV